MFRSHVPFRLISAVLQKRPRQNYGQLIFPFLGNVVVAKERKMEQKKRHPSKTGKKVGKEKDHGSHLDSAYHRGFCFRICLQQNARIINLKYIINN